MADQNKPLKPYKILGVKLKRLREKNQESINEASDAVEVDVALLTQIESGERRPSEDILLLLISHYDIHEDEALQLWEMAGFDRRDVSVSSGSNDEASADKQAIMLSPHDARIVYTDIVHVMVNNYGVVMNFMQGAGPNNQPLAVSRIGMSKEHARSVLEVLRKTLEQSEPSQLPDSTSADAA